MGFREGFVRFSHLLGKNRVKDVLEENKFSVEMWRVKRRERGGRQHLLSLSWFKVKTTKGYSQCWTKYFIKVPQTKISEGFYTPKNKNGVFLYLYSKILGGFMCHLVT